MTKFTRSFVFFCSIATLSACSQANTVNRVFNSEAGAFVDTGYFGNATMNNTMIQSGERSAVANLSRRFSEEVTNTVNFAFNSAQLDVNAKAVLRKQADWIRQFPEVRFRVYGYADAVGGNAYNKRIGKRRADAVVNYLALQGISRSRVEAVVSYGETRPLVVTQGRERLNRRAVTDVVGFVGGKKGYLSDGEYALLVRREYVESATAMQTVAEAESGGLDQ